MFKTIRLKNFRTHIDTEINLSDLTLVIGANNSGKSNLLSGINHFSKLISRAFPENEQEKEVYTSDFYPHRHSLSKDNDPMSFQCTWIKNKYKFDYEIQLYINKETERKIGCKEKLIVFDQSNKTEFNHGYDDFSSQILLRTKLDSLDIESTLYEYIIGFFKSLSFAFFYNLQPSFLKGIAVPLRYNYTEQKYVPMQQIDFCNRFEKQKQKPNLAIGLGEQGHNFQELVKYVKKHEEQTYGRFRGYLQRFVKSFNSIIIDRGITKWQFDMGGNNFPYYDAEKVSEGLLKAGAVALLCAMRSAPAIIMLEEVENGINQKNLSEFLAWLKSTSEHSETQFILTSHSPSVIREFNRDLDNVYKVDLKEKSGYKSHVTNLNDALTQLASLGTIDEDAIIGYKEKGDKKVVQIREYELTELFYNGVLGNL